MVNFEENYHFQGSGRGPTFSRGGQLFPGGGGSNCLFPRETHITCDFPGGGPDPICPPLNPHLPAFELTKASAKFEVATSNRLGGNAFTRKCIISLLTLT